LFNKSAISSKRFEKQNQFDQARFSPKIFTNGPHCKACKTYIACLHDQNKSGFCGRPAFIQPIRAKFKKYSKALIG